MFQSTKIPKKAIIATIIVLIFITPFATGLGISPGMRTFDYTPGENKTVELTIYNNNNVDMNCVIDVRGKLADNIKLSKKQLSFTEKEDKKKINYTLNMPKILSEPGVHTAEITVKTYFEDAGNTTIRPSLMVISRLNLRVPYPEKYARGKLLVDNVKRGETAEIFIRFTNLGEDIIDKVKADIDIKNPQGDVLKELKSNIVKIEPTETKGLRTRVETNNLKPGDYIINATINYDGERIMLSDTIEIEEFLIELISIAVESFNLGNIIDFEILVKNIGNKAVKDFYANIFLKDEDERVALDTKSYKIELNPGDTKKTKIYWDTEGVSEGKYSGELSLKYKEDKLVERFETDVRTDDIDLRIGSDITGKTISQEKTEKTKPIFNWVNILFTVFIALLVILLLYQINRKNSGKRPEK